MAPETPEDGLCDGRPAKWWRERYYTQKRLVTEAREAHVEQNREINYLRRFIREETGTEVPSRSSQ